jgi:cell division septation protein DedD
MTPEDDDDYLADGRETRSASRRLLAAGWLRALLVLGALAVVVVITVPYILQWLETGSTDRPAMTDAQVTRPAPAPPTQIETAPAAPSAPSAPSAPAPAVATAPAAKEPPAAKDVGPAKDVPAAKEMPAAKEPPKAVASAPRSELPAKAATATAPGPAKDMPASKPPAKAPPVTARATAPTPAAPTSPLNGGGSYGVQVGLFENAGNAERLAQDLRANRFAVQVAQVSRGGAVPAVSRHEVFVTGSSVDAVTAALKGSGTAQAVTGGVAVRPALDLKDAVTLSRRLASEGLEVRIRRAASAPAGSGATVHLVRVGDYATSAEAQAGKKQLAAKGIGGFVTQGAAK